MSPVAIPDRWRVFGGVLLALLLAYLVLVHWWFTAPMLAMGSEIESMRDQEQALLGEVAQRPQLLKALADVRKFEASNPGFLPESSREEAQDQRQPQRSGDGRDQADLVRHDAV